MVRPARLEHARTERSEVRLVLELMEASNHAIGAPSTTRTCDLLVRRMMQVLFLEGSSLV